MSRTIIEETFPKTLCFSISFYLFPSLLRKNIFRNRHVNQICDSVSRLINIGKDELSIFMNTENTMLLKFAILRFNFFLRLFASMFLGFQFNGLFSANVILWLGFFCLSCAVTPCFTGGVTAGTAVATSRASTCYANSNNRNQQSCC